ncbi:hypothetical protein ACH42_16355 [Endozoicomonas sp. (ex Bugula neritina AB1)]|nr:hypothetical protein ACH42_16355 [Endozoicomonas sp. (ex Bugula neritina AB1)]
MSQQITVTKRFLVLVFRQFSENRCTENAAALTYTTLFAVVPMMTVTYSMLSAVPSLNGVGEAVQGFVFENFVPSTSEVIQTYLHDFSQQARKLTVVGIIFLLVTSFLMLRTIDKALNNIWQVHRVRRGVSGFLLYWAILSLGPLMFGAGFLLTSYLASLKFISDTTAFLGAEALIFRMAPILLSTMVFALLYSAVPNRKVQLQHAFTGALVVALLVECAKAGFALFIGLSPSYQVIYGAFAAVPLFLLWIYLTWMLVLLGAVIVRSMGMFTEVLKGEKLPPFISILVVLRALQVAFRQGRGLTFAQFDHQQWQLGVCDWEEHTARLTEMGLLGKNDAGEYILSRDLREVNLARFYAELPWPLPRGAELDLMVDDSRPAWFTMLSERLRSLENIREQELDYLLDDLLSR